MENTATWGYLVVWEFRPNKGVEDRFEEAYGSEGVWAELLRQGEGCIGTELNRDLKDSNRYITLDFWTSKQAYEAFRSAHLAEYESIVLECEALTESETELGTFERL